MKISIICFILSVFYYGCTSKEILSSSPKKLKPEEIKELNFIVEELRDTLLIILDKEYENETYSYLPETIRTPLQKAIINQGLFIRADSSYYLGLKQAITNIKKGSLIRKTYGLGRILEIDGLQNKWKSDVVFSYILLNKYSIETDIIAGCMVNPSITAYKEGYDRIFIPVINKFYGYDVIKKAFDEIPTVIINEGEEHKEWIYKDHYVRSSK